tara:strand:+ start:195 stop:359 length:165 start_codon:yes stop_codon:yes gene_type:complete
MTQFQVQQAQEEMHQLMVIRDFGALIKVLGPATVLSKLDKDAADEIKLLVKGVW